MKKKKDVKYLVKGGESKERIDCLIELTNIRSEKAISAIKDHLYEGMTTINASELNKHEHLSRDIKVLNKAAGIVERIKDLDWARFKKENQ